MTGTAGPSPTIRDVARQAGVSPMSVSRALRGASGVSEQTRRAIVAAAEQVGYQSNETARRLRSGGPNQLISLVVTNLRNPFYAELAVGVERVATAHKSRLMIRSTMGDPETEREVVGELGNRSVDGVIVVPAGADHDHLDPARLSGRPVVLATAPPNGIAADHVIVDDFTGMRALCRRLIDQGHRRIGYLGVSRALWTGSERLRGYAAALSEAKIPIDNRLIAEHRGAMDWAQQTTRRFLRSPRPPTAVIAGNNLMTIGALRAARDADSDVSLAGFDDIAVADLFVHPLTLVSYRPDELGARAADLLFARIDAHFAAADPGGDPIRRVIPTTLVEYPQARALD